MNAIKTLERLIEKSNYLLGEGVTAKNPQFQAWYTDTQLFLSEQYGEDSIQFNKFINLKFYEEDFPFTDNGDAIACAVDLRITQEHLAVYLERMKEEQTESTLDKTNIESRHNFQKVFIVHGHDEALKHSVARIVEKQGLEAIILSEKTNQGKTIIEKFEAHSDVGGAICLFTADDMGKAKAETTENPRARQNVVFEAGYFMGKLGRNHVVMICEAGVEIPGDLSGVVYTSKSDWKTDVLKELKAMGYSIDMNKLFE